MSQDQQFLSPDQQDQLFKKLQEAGLLSKDIGQSTDTSDTQAQSGVGGVDFSTLQSLIRHASNPNAVPMQEGDQAHPMDVIHQIGSKMFGGSQPTAPTNAPGSQIIQNPPAQGIIPRLLGMKQPGNFVQTPTQGLIPSLLGQKNYAQLQGPNLYMAIKQAGADKYLDPSLPKLPDGTPFVDSATAAKVLEAKRIATGTGNENYSKAELISQGLPEDVANQMAAAAAGSGKQGVSSKIVANYLGDQRLQTQRDIANARMTLAGVAKLNQALKVGGFDAQQAMAETANKNLGLTQRAQQTIDQIVESGGMADERQRADLAASIAAVAGNSSGVLTDQRMNEFLPQTAKTKFGNWKEYFLNERGPVDFSGFLPQLQDLLTKEKNANAGVANAASQLGLNIMTATGQGNTAGAIGNARNASPLVGNNPINQTITRPTAGNFTPDVLNYAQKYGISPQQALQIKLKRGAK